MTNQNRPGSNRLEDKLNQSGKKRNKAHLPIVQRLSFSVGHFLNDAVVGAWVSYLLIFQTKVLGISNSTAGYLWIVPSSIDAVTSLVVGYVCDNLKFPLFAKYYGKRKSFHLLGTVLVAGLFPFLMMPCFVCGEDSSEWKLGIYYGAIMVTHNVGWALSQVTHLALIPEIAQRPNEMVELHALRSGITFVSGIFMYAITWILLRTDGGNENISKSQWKDFMKMAVIVVGSGCLFSLIFHLGTKEPPAEVQNEKGTSDGLIGRDRQRSHTATLPLPDKAVGVYRLYDETDLNALPADFTSLGTDTPRGVINEEQLAGTVFENKAPEDSCSIPLEKIDIESQVTDLEKNMETYKFSVSNPGFKTEDEQVMDVEKAVVVCEKQEKQTKKEKFGFSNPAFISEDKQNIQDEISQDREGLEFDPHDKVLMDERQNKNDSSDFNSLSERCTSSPETNSVYSVERSIAEGKIRTQQSDYVKDESESASPARPSSLSCRHSRGEMRKTWTDWFKTPLFYKISFAYMCTRLVQSFTSSYAPMYLTDTLEFEKESIAYFPLVILISGIFSSLGAKKLNGMLGAKWTYCLAASLVICSSAWFFLQGTSGRNAAYGAAILLGCGGSVMYVTSTALAGELIGENKDSGAFVFASMGILAKVVCGGAIFLTQEFFPVHGATSEYIRYVFSMVPGAGSILGFFAVIAFLPATVRCRKVVHTADKPAQTEDMIDILYNNSAALYHNYKENEPVIHVTSGKARVVS